jgi:hypothetical protein
LTLALPLTLTLPLALTLTLPLALTLTLPLALPAWLRTALALALTLPLAARLRAALALALPLPLPAWLRAALALLPLPLTWSTLTLPAGVGEVTTGVLQARRGLGQIAVRPDVRLGPRHRFAEPVERRARAGGIALGEALCSFAQRRRGSTVRTGGRRLHLGKLAGELTLFVRRHLVEPVDQRLKVVMCLLRIALPVRVRVARRGA